MIFRATIASLIVAMGLVAACGSDAKLGESCSKEGDEGECVEEGICGKDSDGVVRCLLRCKDQANCATGQSCDGVSGTNIKGCRVKK